MSLHAAFAPTARRTGAAIALLGALAAACAGGDDAVTAPATASAAAAAPHRSTAVADAGPVVGATMRFGRPEMNSLAHMPAKAFEHARLGHPIDKVYPGTVTIARGQTVAFESFPVHQIAVYAPGTRPEDIRLDPEHLADAETPWGETFPDVLIDDPANRLAVSPISFRTITWNAPAGTFTRPGRYLVICTLVFHYVPAKMYGWVVVR